jgi:hypothetical protein
VVTVGIPMQVQARLTPKPSRSHYFITQLERETGFEPATSTLARLRSLPTELLPHVSFYLAAYEQDLSAWDHASFSLW